MSEPSDEDGHGTHTAATAAGNFVKDANLFGSANGTAVGIAPLAHVAVYQACSVSGCSESKIIASMDAAISDGVDILSLSIGGEPNLFYEDSLAIGAYAAMKNGIFVSCSAGNGGPFNQSLVNEAPWIMTVGASTHDRRVEVSVVLGNNQELLGQSAFQPKGSLVSTTKLELAFPNATFCEPLKGRYDGKIVVCLGDLRRVKKGIAVKEAGGAGMILVNTNGTGYVTLSEPHVLPAAHIGYEDGLKLMSYANSASKPVASLLFRGTHIGDKNAPIVTGFSSRGPSTINPGILKPDIVGPGASIVAAVHKNPDNSSKPGFDIYSGTSMSCPHLSGVAALLKSAHPDWSPAAIKSAMITTAQTLNLDKKPLLDQELKPANVYATGAGQVNPSAATDPGLIYDLKPEDYIPYLCGLNYTSEQVGKIVKHKVDCAKEPKISQAQLNYPSFSIVFNGSSIQTCSRIVTNVGEANSAYEVKIESPPSVSTKVEPTTLTFTKVGQQLSYNVTFTRSPGSKGNEYGRGSITWNSANHVVRSPVGFIFS